MKDEHQLNIYARLRHRYIELIRRFCGNDTCKEKKQRLYFKMSSNQLLCYFIIDIPFT